MKTGLTFISVLMLLIACLSIAAALSLSLCIAAEPNSASLVKDGVTLQSDKGPAVKLDWPQFLGPNRDGISPETGIRKDWNARSPRELWRIEMHDNGYAGPSVAAGRLYIIDHIGSKDVVRAIDIRTGRDVWNFEYEDATRHDYGFARSTPTYSDGLLYTVSREGRIHCLNARNGQKLWMVDMRIIFSGRAPTWGYSSSVLVDGDSIIVLPGGRGAAVAALDKKNGHTLWTGGGSDVPGYATPVATEAFGKRAYVIFTAASVMGVDAASGKQTWRNEWRTEYDINAATPLIIGKNVFITSDYGTGCALLRVDGSKAEIAWINTDIMARFSSPIFYDGHIYSTSDRHGLVCMDARTGTVRWKHREFIHGGLVGCDKVMIVMDGSRGDAAMVKLDPSGYIELGRFKPLGGQSWTAPIIADGKLYVRNRSALACFDLK